MLDESASNLSPYPRFLLDAGCSLGGRHNERHRRTHLAVLHVSLLPRIVARPSDAYYCSVLILRRSHQKVGVILAAIGCLILTVTVARESILGLHVGPLQARPPYLVFIVMIIVTVLADAAAWRLHRHAFSAREQIT